MKDLLKTLSEVLRLVGNQPEVVEAATIAAWRRAVGDGLRQHAIPIRLEGAKLVVAVADNVWQKQLGAMKDELIYKTNSTLGQAIVREVELVIDPGVATSPKHNAEEKPSLDNEVPLELWSAASAISDKELRQKFLRAATSAIQRREKEKTNE